MWNYNISDLKIPVIRPVVLLMQDMHFTSVNFFFLNISIFSLVKQTCRLESVCGPEPPGYQTCFQYSCVLGWKEIISWQCTSHPPMHTGHKDCITSARLLQPVLANFQVDECLPLHVEYEFWGSIPCKCREKCYWYEPRCPITLSVLREEVLTCQISIKLEDPKLLSMDLKALRDTNPACLYRSGLPT